jgi:hypothetical protein
VNDDEAEMFLAVTYLYIQAGEVVRAAESYGWVHASDQRVADLKEAIARFERVDKWVHSQ